MRAVLNTCIILLIANVAILFLVYGTGGSIDNKDAAQSLSRLISAYSEPNSNPQFLVRDENQCRFWGQGYCARAQAKRKAVTAAYSFNPTLPASLQSTELYQAYVEGRKALMIATTDYVAFLNTSPPTEQYIAQSKVFEEQAGVLVGQLVTYLYDMQGQTIQRQTNYTEQILMLQYLCLVVLLFFICLLRFRRGGFING